MILQRTVVRILKRIVGIHLTMRSRWRRRYWSWRVRRSVASCETPPKVNQRTLLNRQTHLGRNTNFNGLVVAGRGGVTIGDNFHSGVECRFITQDHQYDSGNAIPYDTTEYVLRPIVIEDNVWLGDRVMVLGGVTIGEGAIIQAGSVVVCDIPPLAIAGGHPAKVFKQRDRDHYLRLKAAGKFC